MTDEEKIKALLSEVERINKLYTKCMKDKEKVMNEKDSILQAVYNDLKYGQPVKFSLKSKLVKHCNERTLDLPEELK